MTGLLLQRPRLQNIFVDDYLRDFYFPFLGKEGLKQSFSTPCDIIETENTFVVRIDVPGLKKEEIELDYKENVLSVAGVREENFGEAQSKVHLSERKIGKFRRSFAISNINADKIEATYAEGVLTIILPKSETAKPKKITVA